MSNQLAKPVFLNDARPTSVIDDAAVTRAQDVLTANGVTVDAGTLASALAAAVTPTPSSDNEIPVSVGMLAAGRDYWIAHSGVSVHALLPALYRVMEQRRRDEDAAVAVLQAVDVAPAVAQVVAP